MANTLEPKTQDPLQIMTNEHYCELRLKTYNISLERLKESYWSKIDNEDETIDNAYPSPHDAIQEANVLLAFITGERTGDSFLDGVLIHEDEDGWIHIKDGTAPASFLFNGMPTTRPTWIESTMESTMRYILG